jgi:hypothetical protein
MTVDLYHKDNTVFEFSKFIENIFADRIASISITHYSTTVAIVTNAAG